MFPPPNYCRHIVFLRLDAALEQQSHNRKLALRAKYCIVENFRWCTVSRKCIQTLQKKFSWFLFSRNKRDALTTPLSVDGHVHMRAEETTLNDEANKQACATTAQPSFCVDAIAISKVSRLPLRARNNRRIRALLISTSTTSERLSRVFWHFCKVGGRFFSTATIQRADRLQRAISFTQVLLRTHINDVINFHLFFHC